MFNLEQSIDAWCKAVGKNRCGQKGNLDELKDHLFCQVEALMAQSGAEQMSEESAFYCAIEQLGETDELAGEYAKNRSAWSKICTPENDEIFDEILQESESMSAKLLKKIMISNAILWAAAMLSISYVLKGSEQSSNVLMLLIFLSTASIIGLGGFRNSAKAECEFIKSKFKSAKE